MIAKLTTGDRFGGAIKYDVRYGKKGADQEHRLLGLSGVTFDFDENGHVTIDPLQVARDFRLQVLGYRPETAHPKPIRKPVYHWALSWKKGERKIPEKEMIEVAKEFLRRIGFVNTQYLISAHYDKENQHLHIVTNVINNEGKRISTFNLIDKAHKISAAITKERGYAWGEKASAKTVKAAHKPHEKVRYSIEPIVKKAVAQASSIDELPTMLANAGIHCRIKYSSAGNPVGISFALEHDGQLHTFKGSDLDRSLSAGNIAKSIADRLAQEEASRTAVLKELARQQQEAKRKAEEEQHKKEEAEARRKAEVNKARDMIAGYNSIIPPMCRENVSLITVRKNAYQLMKAVDEAKIAVSKETSAKFEELKDTWNDFNRLNQERQETKEASGKIAAIGGMLMLLNPIIGLTVMFLAKVANDIRQSEIKAQKKQLLTKVEAIRSEVSQLQQQKAQLKIEKQERLQEYLEAKQMLKEYNEGLKTVDRTVHDTHIDILKEEFPFKDNGHVQYIIHGPYDASIFRPEEGAIKEGEGSKYKTWREQFENARQALKNKVLFVAGDSGPHDFYETLLQKQKNGNFRVGDMHIHPDGKITFGEERVFGDPKLTEHSVPKIEEPVVQKPIPAVEKKTVQAAPSTQPANTAPKSNFEIVRTFTANFVKFRIKKEADGVYKLQQLDWDRNSIVDGKYTKQAWYLKAKFTSFSEVANDTDGVYFKIKDLDTGKTRYINQYGNDLSNKQLQRLGLANGNGMGGRSM